MKTTVAHAGGMKFVATSLHHTTIIDFPEKLGGKDEAPNPYQLFVSSLGACLGAAIVEYCKTVGLSSECLRLDLTWETHEDPARIDSVLINIQLPSETWQKRGDAIKELLKHCPIYRTMQSLPHMEVDIGLSAEPE